MARIKFAFAILFSLVENKPVYVCICRKKGLAEFDVKRKFKTRDSHFEICGLWKATPTRFPTNQVSTLCWLRSAHTAGQNETSLCFSFRFELLWPGVFGSHEVVGL